MLRDADDGAVDRVVELIAAQDDVERLIPRHVGQLDVDRALHVGVDDHVQPADVGERAQHRAQIDAVEIEAERIAGVLSRLIPAGRRRPWSRGRLRRGGLCARLQRGALAARPEACGACAPVRTAP